MPDMKIEHGAPTYLPFKQLVHELERYQQQHGLKVTFNSTVIAVRQRASGFLVRYQTSDGGARARGVHSWQSCHQCDWHHQQPPKLPENFKLCARVPWMHSIDARAEHLAKSRKLLVIGGGASAAEVLENWLKVRQKDDRAWLSLRSRLFAVPHWIFGIDVHYFAWLPGASSCMAALDGASGRLTEPMTGGAVRRRFETD